MEKIPCEPQVGADIEVFLHDDTKGTVVPCVGIIKGTKNEPWTPEEYRAGFSLQEDNVMLEYNIPPARTCKAFTTNMQVARTMIKENLPDNHSYRVDQQWTFMPGQLRSKQAKTFGCSPDFDAYEGGQERQFPLAPIGDANTRTCGGHIHIGGSFNCPDFVAALFADLWLGVICATGPRKQNVRTAWYGKPGIYRPKPYGIEYRTPDNFWTKDKNKIYYVGSSAIKLSTWLSSNEAAIIKKVFNAVTWPRVRNYMSPAHPRMSVAGRRERAQEYEHIMREAIRVGVPIE